MGHANRKSMAGALMAMLLCLLAMALPTIAHAADSTVKTDLVGVNIASDSAVKESLDAYRLVDATCQVKADDLTEDDVAYTSDKAHDAIVDALGRLTGSTWDGTAYEALSKLSAEQDDDSAQVACVLARSVIGVGLTPTMTVPSDGRTVDVASGLYVFVPHDASGDSTGTLGSSMPILYLLNDADNGVTISEKGSVPSIDKSVNGVKVLAAGMGETLSYDVTVTLPDGYDAFDKYPIVVGDTLDNGLTLDEGSVTLSDDAGSQISHDAYTVAVSKSDDGRTMLAVSMDDVKAAIPMLSSSRHLYVRYTASLNADACAGTDGPNENSVTLSYHRSPYASTMVTSIPSITKTLTACLDITKVDRDTRNALDGARMALRRVSDGKWWDGSAWSDDQSDFPVDGETTLPAISSGKYELSETHAPDGYDAIGGRETIDVATGTDDDGKLSLDVTVSSSDGLVSVASSDAQTGKASIIVSDPKSGSSSSGSVIRQTGDMVVRAVAAAALVAAAVVIVIIVVRHGRK